MKRTPVTIDPAAFEADKADQELLDLNARIVKFHETSKGLWSMPVTEVRRLRRQGEGVFPKSKIDPEAQTIIHLGAAGREIAVRVFRPSNGSTRGTYLHMHGGGWVFGAADEADEKLRRIAENTDLTVASVEYRLAPEHPFPAGPDDCLDIAVALANGHLKDVPRGFLAIGGESAGAHLAVLTLLRLRDEYHMMPYKAANLVAGCYDLSLTPSVRAAGPRGKLILDADDVKEFVLRFVPDTMSLKDPAVSPLYADLSGLPAALFSCGTKDLLIDDTMFMAARWLAAGNSAELSLTNGGCHVFEAFDTKPGRESLGRMEDFLKARLDRGY